MKKKLVAVALAAVFVLGGCVKGSEPAQDSMFEQVGQSSETGEETADTAGQNDAGSGEEGAATGDEVTTESCTSENAGDDYTEQIRSEIADITATSESLSAELVNVNKLYDKYDELRMNAPDQTSINLLSKWGTQVWKDEVASLLSRIQEKDPMIYSEIQPDYEKWERYVPSMAEKMSETYKEGSIYAMIYNYNEAMRYKQKAFSLASTLADLNDDVAFELPDSTPCGYYGDYDGDHYLIITEGMENGSYDILIHIDDSKVIKGWATTDDYPGGVQVLRFNSDDGNVAGTIDFSIFDSTFYVSETDGSIVGPEEAYSFTFKY
ncbi:MAG: hypothetical protein K6C96_05315 [Butyrivibrio sp.]|nr:hypothetical protein [Butyrivibrio sp.]